MEVDKSRLSSVDGVSEDNGHSAQLHDRKWQATFDAIKDAVFMCDLEGTILQCNRSVTELLGKPSEEIVGRKCYELVHGTHEPVEDCPVMRMRHSHHNEESVLPAGGRWFSVTADPVFDNGSTLCAAVHTMRDITDQKRAESEREELIAELERKNAELERLSYTVSHDLKSPLITIKGFIGLLRADVESGDQEAAEEKLRRIDLAADRMHRLLDDLLRLSRIGRVVEPSEDVPLVQLAQEAVNAVAGRLLDGTVQVVISPELPTVHGDRGRLLDVLQNLIENAAKYMGDQPNPRIEVGSRSDDTETVVWVRDNGIGVEPRYHEKVFELFTKLATGGDGTGVGLALVKRIIELHGGQIWIESEGAGHGSRFCFTLPLGHEEATP